MNQEKLELQCVNTIRTLAMDAVEKAGSGHPGTAMALAPAAFVLWDRIMKYNPQNPKWYNRDRFILSNGHASILQYSMLHLTGYDLPMDEIKQFRQWGSKTPGHPEYGHTEGIETTTGPLGQGFMNGVGMAMAEAHLAKKYNRDDLKITDHHTYVFCSDGDLMEGASHEAASLAGHFGLGKLICLYDDNHISIDGETEITYSDDVHKRFEGYHWHVQNLGESANDLNALTEAFKNAWAEPDKPSMIILRSHIGYGAPTKQDTADAHGSALGEEEIRKTKEAYGWPADQQFLVPDEVKSYMRKAKDRGETLEQEWTHHYKNYKKSFPDLAKEFDRGLNNELPDGWDCEIPEFSADDGKMATRGASSKVINNFMPHLPCVIGGSADLAASTKTLYNESNYFGKENYENRNIPWGVRELGMCGASTGITLHGGLRAFAATFFIFSDYARPAIRLAALMKLPVVYVFTHDSIGLGGDGPTHQPVAHLASFRAMPNIHVFRPADANEVSYTWRAALNRKDGPTIMALTRQKLPVLDRTNLADAEGTSKGAYVLSKEKADQPEVLIMATGSEVQLALKAQQQLWDEKVDSRVVSMPCWELFKEQPESYRESVIPKNIKKRIAIEAGSTFGWSEWIGDEGSVIGLDRFGASANYEDNFEHFGFTVSNIVDKARELVNKPS
ncbi:MAG TPA: transketolase [Sunxiuqinia sp.]|nr:transketolase [Sunxiuqinia sp.]